MLPDAFASDPERLARFRREAQVLASLNHPNIAHLYGLEQADGVQALVMELVEGPTLADRLARGPIPVDEALPIARQVCEALEAAHEQGIVHRDLKPANIKVRPDGTVKVLDFGLAKALNPTATRADATAAPTITSPAMMTGVGVLLGTAAYTSPEQTRGQAVDKRTDIWSFGCVLYEILTGRRAFAEGTLSDTIARVLQHEPDWTLLPPRSTVLAQLLRRCLVKDPRRRLRDMGDARIELENALAAPPVEQSVFRRRTRHIAAWVGAAAAMAAVVALSVLALPRAGPEIPVLRREVGTPPTNDPASFALSPDGRQLVFVASADGQATLWIRRLDETTARPLAGTEGASYPFWSPDSRSVAFFANDKVMRVDLPDGRPRILADLGATGRGGTWNQTGDILFASIDSGIRRIPAAGGTVTPVTTVGSDGGGRVYPEFLPDGRQFLFFVGFRPAEVSGVFLGSLDTSETRRLMPADSPALYAPPGYLLTVRQGVLVAVPFDAARGTLAGDPIPVSQTVGVDLNSLRGAFSVSGTGLLALRSSATTSRQLVWVDRTGRIVESLGTPEESGMLHPELSPSGTTIAVQRTVRGNYDIWLIDASGGSFFNQFTFDSGVDSAPVWSTDGSRVLFRSNRNGRYDLFEKPASGAQDERMILASPENKFPVDWSSNGTVLYFVERPGTGTDLWAARPDGRPPFPVVETQSNDDEGQFSPDGNWIAYRSNASGQAEIYVRPFSGPGGLRRVSVAGGDHARWRRDGKELFYVASNNILMAVPVEVSSSQVLRVGTPRPLFEVRLPAIASRSQYAVSADGQRFLLNIVTDQRSAPITIVQNWSAGL